MFVKTVQADHSDAVVFVYDSIWAGEFVLMPFKGGEKTFVFATVSIMIERDESLTARIIKTGEYPFEPTLKAAFARDIGG